MYVMLLLVVYPMSPYMVTVCKAHSLGNTHQPLQPRTGKKINYGHNIKFWSYMLLIVAFLIQLPFLFNLNLVFELGGQTLNKTQLLVSL
jgi:hypothetical protein